MRRKLGHPLLMARQDALLWSINERLAGREGLDVEAPTLDWVETLIEAAETGEKSEGLDELEEILD